MQEIEVDVGGKPLMPDSAVAVGHEVQGAITTGPASFGKISVMGKTQLPGDFQICGDRYSVVNKVLQPGESYVSEPGAMMYMSDKSTNNNVTMRASWGIRRLGAAISGESFAKVIYTNRGDEVGFVGITPNMPYAIVMPFDVSSLGNLYCKRGAFMAGDTTIRVSAQWLPTADCFSCIKACCAGQQPVIQGISGQGTALLEAGGTVVCKDLAPGERFLIDSDALVAFTADVKYDNVMVGSFTTCCFGGEGCWNTELTGPGKVYVQTLSYEKLLKWLVKVIPSKQDKQEGEGQGQDGSTPSGAPLASEQMQR